MGRLKDVIYSGLHSEPGSVVSVMGSLPAVRGNLVLYTKHGSAAYSRECEGSCEGSVGNHPVKIREIRCLKVGIILVESWGLIV